MAVIKLGTLRYILVKTIDTLAAGNEDSTKTVPYEGDKYSYAIDGIIIHANSITNPHKLLINFSLFTALNVEERIISNLPYSLRGTRNNEKYIPTKKDTDYPILPARQPLYLKLTNNDPANDVEGIAWAVLGYPIIQVKD